VTLFTLLDERQEEILDRCRTLMNAVMGSRPSSYQLDEGLPIIYSELVHVFKISLENDSLETRHKFVHETVTAGASRQHARESFRLGFTVSQLVHGYGCICQGITEFAHIVGANITSREFSQLNLCLDVAIAQAVTEFEALSLETYAKGETMRLGFLVHELRNYLASATMAHELIKAGGVGIGGSTSAVLANSHLQMKNIIDRAMAEIRLNEEPVVDRSHFPVFSLLSEVEAAALPEANAKNISLNVDADPSLMLMADRHLMASAIANLVQNGIKYTHSRGTVYIRAFAEGGHAIIEIEDRCGGLPMGKVEELFKPFVKANENQSGLGLGLSISRRAIELNGGTLSARDLPGTGCVFTASMPAALPEPSKAKFS
jgi:signal transduction histidine kinase